MTNDVQSIGAQAAARLNLDLGRDNVWRGRCPSCGYGKPTLQMKIRNQGIAISCAACGEVRAIAAIAGIAIDLLVPEVPTATKVARALELWAKALPATSTPVESYLRGRGLTVAIPYSIRYLPRQRNWSGRGAWVILDWCLQPQLDQLWLAIPAIGHRERERSKEKSLRL